MEKIKEIYKGKKGPIGPRPKDGGGQHGNKPGGPHYGGGSIGIEFAPGT